MPSCIFSLTAAKYGKKVAVLDYVSPSSQGKDKECRFFGLILDCKLAVRMIWPTWFDHLEESFSYKEVQFKQFCVPVKTSCPCAENVNATPGSLYIMWPVVSKLLVFLLTGTANLLLCCSRFHLGPWWNLCQCGMYP